ncbi:Pro-Pol poly [Paramuricea clavata]|uniref:Pro-Pol poly n=1 Tax=Paramuricea clavata TaxID=317549 RepID=A0A6S7HWM2_PARCT|nr:Pro-Pol poly [Paramuricea clavata]
MCVTRLMGYPLPWRGTPVLKALCQWYRVIEKLPGIKAELVTNQVGWQDWGFADLLKALENWKAIHPVESSTEHNPRTPYNRNHSFFSKDSSTPKGCVYCDDEQHKSYESQCRSRVTGFHCKKKHHSSICDTLEKPPHNQIPGQAAVTATHEEQKVCHTIVIVKANGITCRALLDTGATTSYASAYLLSLMKINPSNTLTRCIQTITGTIITKHVEIYNLEVSNTEGNFVIPANVRKVDHRNLDLVSCESKLPRVD